ncbi:MAG: hypothetical protein EOP14_01170 [Pseudomonas sp.]|nr:MAG: hypothetical protein EOP14_01170 [Pseudomonas sp.]
MTTRDYLLRSVLVLVAAIAGYPGIIWLGHSISGGGMGGMFAALVLVPIMLVVLAVYWISVTRKRAREAELALPYQVTLYASLIGAAQGFVIFPMVIAGNVAVSRISTAESLRYIVDPFLPLIMLLMLTIFVGFVPAHTGRVYSQRLAGGTIAATVYTILSLAPHFAWPLRGIWPGNPYSIQSFVTLGLPPTLPAVLALLMLGFFLFRQYRDWALASEPASPAA